MGMQCPYCHYEETKVTDSRDTGIYTIRRRRECLRCHRRFTTYEHIDLTPIYVIKKDGRRERYDKNKIRTGVMKALEKRHHLGKEEIKSSIIGEYVMDALRELDQVAYIRFASVYRAFADITLFEEEVKKLTKNFQERKK